MSQIVTDYTHMRGMGQEDYTGPSFDPNTGAVTGGWDWSSFFSPISTPTYTAGGISAPNSPATQSSASGAADIINSIANAFKSVSGPGSILASRYAVPQLAPGQLIQTTPYGTTMYQAPAGATSLNLPTSIGGMSSSTLLLVAAGVVALMFMAGRH